MEALRTHVSKILPVTDTEWAAFASILRPKQLKKHEHFLEQGQVCRQMAFILKGYVRFYFLVGAEEITKEFSFEKDFCGSYASFISGQPSRFNVKAMENLSVLVFDRPSLLNLIEKYPVWENFLRISVENLFVRKENREASFLLDSPQEKYQKLMNQHPDMLQRVPLKYLASYMGLSAETLSRIRARQS